MHGCKVSGGTFQSLAIVVLSLLAGVGGPAARGQSLDWAVRAGGTGIDRGHSIAVYGPGKTCVTGSFADFGFDATFGPGQPNETTLVAHEDTISFPDSDYASDIFVASYDGSGQLAWAKRAGGPRWDAGYGAAVDGAGNCYVTGGFQFDAGFGEGEVNETTLTTILGYSNPFIAKFDTTGRLIWAKQASGVGEGEGVAIAADAAGNSYVVGYFEGSMTFGPGEARQTVLNPAGFSLFIAKYDALGSLVWVKSASVSLFRSLYDFPLDIGLDASGNVYIIGSFSGSATFGAGEANATTLTSAGGNDVFVAKLSAAGLLAWAKRAGGFDDDQGYGIAVAGSGDSFVTGDFSGIATFGPGEPGTANLISLGGKDVFVAKLDPAGMLVWARPAGGAADDGGGGIAIDTTHNTYVTGAYVGTATFGGGEANATGLAGIGIFVAKYDSLGALLWAKGAPGGRGRGSDVAVDAAKQSYVTGSFESVATFGAGEAHETTLFVDDTFDFFDDVFVAKYGEDGWTPGTSTRRIHSGELKKSYTDANGVVWDPDKHFLLGGISGTDYVYNTADVELYRKGRRDIYQSFGYAIPVANGDYYVTLKFAEQQVLVKGQRRFHVTIEGQVVLVDFDILAEVPLKTALDKTFAVSVADGTLNIAFERVVNGGIVSAIEVVPLN